MELEPGVNNVFISEWARESLTLTEMAEVQAWAKVNGERVELRYSRSGKCFTATVGTRQGHDQRRAIEAFRKATAPQIVGFLNG